VQPKVKKFLLLFLYISSVLTAEGPQASRSAGSINTAGIQAELVSHALQPDYMPRVNVVTGEYCEEGIDLVVAGIEPLSLVLFQQTL